MTDEEGFFVRLKAVADLTANFELTEPVIEAYDRTLKVYGYRKVSTALDAIMLERSSRDPFPSLKEIITRVDPKQTPTDAATLAVNRIVEALFGVSWSDTARAKELIGDLGWRVVKSCGGWQNLCETVDNRNLPTLKAQWKQLAESLQALPQQADSSPRLPEPQRENRTSLLGLGEVMNLALQRKETSSHGRQEKDQKEVQKQAQVTNHPRRPSVEK